MQITSDHLTGLAVGVGVSAAAFFFYKKNQGNVDDWLRRQGLDLPEAANKNLANMTLEELVREKEHLEDVIAEREMASQPEAAPQEG